MQTLSTLKDLNKIQKDYRNLIKDKTNGSEQIRFSRVVEEKQAVNIGSKSGAYCKVDYSIIDNEATVDYLINNGTVYSSNKPQYLRYVLEYLIDLVKRTELTKIFIPISSIDYISNDDKNVFNELRFVKNEYSYVLNLEEDRNYFELNEIIDAILTTFEELRMNNRTTTFEVTKTINKLTVRFHYRGYNGVLNVIPEESNVLIQETNSKKRFRIGYSDRNITELLKSLLEVLYEENKTIQLINPITPHFDNFCKKLRLNIDTIGVVRNFLQEHISVEDLELISVSKRNPEQLRQGNMELLNFDSFHFVIENKKEKNEIVHCYTNQQQKEAMKKFTELATQDFLKTLNEDLDYYKQQTAEQ